MRIRIEDIPQELQDWPNWVTWNKDKVPYTPGTLRRASVTDPATWRSFQNAYLDYQQGWTEGIGFVFTNTPYAGVDIDHCLTDSQTSPQAARIIALLDSYTEVSPSGTGLHIIVRGYLPPGPRRKGDVEMYDTARYFTITGHVWRNYRIIQPRQAELEHLHTHLFGHPDPSPRPRPSPPVAKSDQELLRTAASAHNGDKFARLWEGDFSDYDSQSEADLALCNFLAFWTGGDPARMDRLFRQSGLFRPKWDEVHYASGQTYGQGTIGRALVESTEDYQCVIYTIEADHPGPDR